MFDRGSWNRRQRRYGTAVQRRSSSRQMLPLTAATTVVVAALAALLASGHGRSSSVTIERAATPPIGPGQIAETIASAETTARAERPSPVVRPKVVRTSETRRPADGLVRVSSVGRVRLRAAAHVEGRSRARRGRALRRAAPRAAVVVGARRLAPSTSGQTGRPSAPALAAPPRPQGVAAAVRPAPPAAQAVVSSSPPCYPGQLNC
jgi:hypothetical protein